MSTVRKCDQCGATQKEVSLGWRRVGYVSRQAADVTDAVRRDFCSATCLSIYASERRDAPKPRKATATPMIPYRMYSPADLLRDLPADARPLGEQAWQAGVVDGANSEPPYGIAGGFQYLQPLYDHGYEQGARSKMLNEVLAERSGARHYVTETEAKLDALEARVRRAKRVYTAIIVFEVLVGLLLGLISFYLFAWGLPW